MSQESKCIAIIGAPNHGKKTLCKVIEKTIKDNMLNSPKANYTFIVPVSCREFIKDVISGKIKVNGVVLGVSAKQGPMPETREYILVCRQLGINRMVVYINNDDEDNTSVLLNTTKDTINLLNEYEFYDDDVFIVEGSAKNALNHSDVESIERLIEVLDNFDKEEI